MSLFDELNNFDNNAFENLNEIKKNAPDFNTIISDIDVPGFPDYESPFGNNSPFASTTKKTHFFTGSTYINKLVDYLNKGSFLFRHSQFLADKITTIPSSKKFEHYLLGHYNHLSKHKGVWLSGKSNIAYKSKLNDLFFDVHLSSSEEHSISKRHPVFAFTINFSESTFRYRVLFQFNGFDANAPFAEQYGINIETASYADLETILTDLKLKYPEYLKEKIIKVFKNAFVDAGGDRNKLDELYVHAPKFVIASRATPTLLADLNNILTGFVDEIGTNEEVAVLNILRGLHSKLLKENKKGHDDFLNALLKPYDDDTTYFERIYDKLNDTGGNNNFKAFIDLVYAVWALSNLKDISRYTTLKDPGPQSLGYTSKKILGFYTDGFNFEFETVDQQRLIRVTHTQKTGGSIKYGNGAITTKNIGYYHPFQPLFLPEITNQKGVIKLPNRIIPAFYLKAFDDKNSWSNFEKQVWLAIDVITTITGVGNLLKFRHLAKLQEAKAVFSLKLGLATIEVTSGTLGILLNFVNDCDPEAKDKSFCQYLREFLIILDIATLSIDGIDNLLRLKARQIIDSGESIIKKLDDAENINTIEKISEDLLELSGLLEEYIELLKKNPAYIRAKKFIENKEILLDILKPELSAMIRIYSGGVYFNLNKSLRKVILNDDIIAMQRVLDKALDALPISKYNKNEFNLYRSIYLKEDEINKLFKEGGEFTDKGFFSTTHSYEAHIEFLKDNPFHNVIFKVQGKNGKLIDELAMLTHEREILFKSGTTFDILKIKNEVSPMDHATNMYIITLKEK